MDLSNTKCVMMIDETLPLGLIANTAAVMGATVGKLFPDAIGPDVLDGDGNRHPGIIAIPIPMLRGNPELLAELRNRLREPKYAGLAAIDFTDVAGSCHTYDAFIEKMAGASDADMHYYGIAICGDKKLVSQLTGSMALLR